MRYLILMALVAVVSCAPLENEAIRVRRAQEIVMFGNQQNEAKDKVKRSEDDATEGGVDTNGAIVSLEAKDLEPLDETNLDEEVVDNVDEMPETSEASTEEILPGALVPEEDAPNSEEDILGQPGDSVEDEGDENKDELTKPDLQKYYDSVLPSYYYDLMSGGGANQRPNLGYYDLYPFIRKRRSQERIFVGDRARRARILKRSRRIKRDLIYPSESLGNRDYMYGDEYPENNYSEMVGYLLDLLDEKYNEEPAYEEPIVYEQPYQLAPYEEMREPVEELVYPGYEEQVLENAIAKRQAGLTFVPGFKRNFYPYFEEPESHFQAFVPPEKRSQEEYADAYRRVMGLASSLGQNDYYRPSEYDFRRK